MNATIVNIADHVAWKHKRHLEKQRTGRRDYLCISILFFAAAALALATIWMAR